MRLHLHGAAVAALFVAAAAVASENRAAAPAPQPAPHPIVLMLPGRGYLARDTAALRHDWMAALEQGVAQVGAPGLIDEADFRLVWYADVLDPSASAECRTDGTRDHQARPGQELASLLASGMAAAALMADWSELLDGAPLRAVAGDLLYFGDDRKRCAAEERLASTLDEVAHAGRPVVLIAHSFGSLVAHSYLSTRVAPDAPRIERWITIGSLVGRPELRELILGSGGWTAELPRGVGSWVNVRDPEDALAAPLIDLARDSLTAAAVVDRRTEATPIGDPHDPIRYLSDPVTARAVVEGWCGRPVGAAPSGCPTGP